MSETKTTRKKCEHGKERCKCKLCGGTSICVHDKRKDRCRLCGGNSFCKHGKQKYRCIECRGSAICEHKKRRELCKLCNGASFCEHGKRKYICSKCNGVSICEHGKTKVYCKICGGSSLCKSIYCETRVVNKNKYKGYCLKCFMHVFPDEPVTKNYKIKEIHVVNSVKKKFPQFTWVCDKRYDFGACSLRRPDMFCEIDDYVLIVEIDENKHQTYESSCENKRLCELYKDFGFRDMLFIRFNPDDYIDNDNNKVTSCFGYDKNGICKIKKSKQKDYDERIKVLCNTIETLRPTKSITVHKIFYDGY